MTETCFNCEEQIRKGAPGQQYCNYCYSELIENRIVRITESNMIYPKHPAFREIGLCRYGLNVFCGSRQNFKKIYEVLYEIIKEGPEFNMTWSCHFLDKNDKEWARKYNDQLWDSSFKLHQESCESNSIACLIVEEMNSWDKMHIRFPWHASVNASLAIFCEAERFYVAKQRWSKYDEARGHYVNFSGKWFTYDGKEVK